MVTKQQQLEWLAKNCASWPVMSEFIIMHGTNLGICGSCWEITLEEWQQERDKMQKKAEQVAQPAPDNSWHERGELPPVGCECVWVDESGVDCPSGVKYPDVGDVVSVCAHRQTPGGDVIAIFTWDPGDDGLRVAASRMPEDFRPLRTEREKAIDEMFQAAFSIGSEINAETIGALYDAGYRKVKP